MTPVILAIELFDTPSVREELADLVFPAIEARHPQRSLWSPQLLAGRPGFREAFAGTLWDQVTLDIGEQGGHDLGLEVLAALEAEVLHRPCLLPTRRLPAAFTGASRRQPASEHQYLGPYRAFLHECCRYPSSGFDRRERAMETAPALCSMLRLRAQG